MRKPPKPKLPWRQLDPKTRSRFKTKRAKFRAKNFSDKFKTFGEQVKAIRTQFGKNKAEFARMVGVSKVTIRRWENGLGHLPSSLPKIGKNGKKKPSNHDRLAKLAKLADSLKLKGLKLE